MKNIKKKGAKEKMEEYKSLNEIIKDFDNKIFDNFENDDEYYTNNIFDY